MGTWNEGYTLKRELFVLADKSDSCFYIIVPAVFASS